MAKTTAAGGGLGRLTGVWMLLGLAATILFFWWISVTAKPSQVVVEADETADETAAGGASAQAVPLADLLGTPGTHVGQTVRVPSATVSSLLGDVGFWVEGPGGSPFLVVKGEEFVLTGGAVIRPGAILRITGQFWEQSSENVQQWRESGFMTDAGHLAQAEFATHYLQATEVGPADATGAAGQ